MIEWLNHVTFRGDGVNSLDAMSWADQAECLVRYYNEDDNVHDMMSALMSEGSKEGLQTQAALIRALKQAFRSNLTNAGASLIGKEVAFAELGRQLLAHAHRYAQGRIDDYIDDNWAELVDASNEPYDI